MNLCVRLIAQNDMATWYFGNFAGLSFTSTPPTIVLNSAMNASSGGGASIADGSGNLLFYTNGQTVWNKTNAIMANGTGLNNSPSASAYQLPLIVKQPGNSNIYFIITHTALANATDVLCYSTVDMNLAAGLGSVTIQNVVFATGIYRTGIAATRHCNGRDVWLITQRQVGFNNCFYHSFAITASGINGSPVVSPSIPSGNAGYSEMIVSPNGKKIAMTDNGLPSVADFANNTGIVSNDFMLTGFNTNSCQGIAFSPDATRLYTYRSGGYLLQWNTCAGSNASVYASRDSLLITNNYDDLKLAINGKIYLTTYNTSQLAVINFPNQVIASINFVAASQPIAPNFGSYLPKHLNGFKHAPPQTPQFTYTVSNSFGCQTASFTAMPVVQNYTTIGCTVVGYSLTSLAWNFGDPNSGGGNTSNLNSPGHFFSAPGTYTVKLILYYSCNGANDTLSQVVQVNQNCLSVTSGGILCSSLGTATVTSLIGTGPFSYSWIPSGQTGPTASGLSPGTYTVLMQDANNNTFTASTTFTSAVPLTATLSTSGTVSCYGAANGTANIVTGGGSGSQYYLWSNGLSTFTISNPLNLSAGSWSLTVTDTLTNCVADTVFLITQPPPLNIGISPGTSSICLGSGLSLIGSSSGAAGIVYQWQPVTGLSAGNTITVTASPSVTTIYTLSGTFNTCSESASSTVYVVSPPNMNISLSSPTTCAEALNGSPNTITLTAGGASTYTISTPNDIYNSNPSGPSTNLNTSPPHIPGMSTATVYGGNGVCTVSATVIFSIIPNPTVSISTPTPAICAGDNFTYTSAGANSYTWSSPDPNNYIYTTGNIAVTNPSINSLFSVVGGSLGCLSATQISSLTVNPLPVFNITGNTSICIGTSASLSAIGTGTMYNWSPSLFLNNTNSSSVIASPTALQNYVVIGSLNNCTTTAMITVSVLSLPVAQISAPKTFFCQDEDIILFGGGEPMPIVSYTWNLPSNYYVIGKDLQLKALSGGYGGTYTLTVSDQNNCKGSAIQTITVYSLPQGYLSSKTMQGCVPLCTDLSFKSTTENDSITAINWQVENSLIGGSSFKHYFNSPGDYKITGNISDIHNCANTVTAIVNVYPKPKAGFNFSPEQPVENMETVQFTNTSKGADQYYWAFGVGAQLNAFGNSLNSSIKKDPTFLFETSGNYPVALVVQNQWTCSDTIVKAIRVEPDFAVYVPNAFTPNGDGLNELFGPVLRGVKGFTFSIFDRWGQKIYETSDITKGWDGTFKGEVCKQDVYIWKLIVFSENTIFSESGMQEKDLAGEVFLYR